ncbi:MAG: hypothetical protein AAB802_02205 [Patescibacteria group bacterium]
MFNTYVHFKRPDQSTLMTYVNESSENESADLFIFDEKGEQAIPVISQEVAAGSNAQFDLKKVLGKENFTGSALLVIRPSNRNSETFSAKNKDCVYTFLSPNTSVEIGTAAHTTLNAPGEKEKKTFNMFCTAVLSNEKVKTLIAIYNHSTDPRYSDRVSLKPKLQNLNGEGLEGPEKQVPAFGSYILDVDESFGVEGRSLLEKTGGRGSITLQHKGHTFGSFFFHMDKESEALISGSHTQPPTGIFSNPESLWHYWLTPLAKRFPFSTQAVALARIFRKK